MPRDMEAGKTERGEGVRVGLRVYYLCLVSWSVLLSSRLCAL